MHLTINSTVHADITETALDSIVWNGETYTESGNYDWIGETANGCDSIVTLHLTIVNINVGITTHDTDNGVGGLHASQDGAEYQWYDCDTDEPIEGATEQDFYPDVVGSYYVVITYMGFTDTSDCYEVTDVVGLNEASVTNIVVYPNPTHGIIHVQMSAAMNMREIRIYNAMGKLVQHKVVNRSTTNVEIDATTFAPGTYFMQCVSDQGVVTKKFIKQ